MVKTAFLINSMAGGGAERVLSLLLRNLSRENRKFFLIILENKFYYDVPKDVEVIRLCPSSNNNNNFKKFLSIFWAAKELKKIVKKNNIGQIVSLLGRSNYINILSKIAGSKHKAIISERINPSKMHQGKSAISFLNKLLTKKLYKKADLIIANSKGIKESLAKDFFVSRKKITVVYNLFDFDKIKQLSSEQIDSDYEDIFRFPVVINVARLSKQKGQEYLIRAFKKVKKEIPEAKLVILGEGELKNNLIDLIGKLSLKEDVYLLGWQKNPFKFISKSKVFVLSSLWEGFPNALIEAMGCSSPVISTNCPSGPDEIITSGQDGILVPVAECEKLAEAMINILKNLGFAKNLSDNARKRAEGFSIKNIINQYEDLFKIYEDN